MLGPHASITIDKARLHGEVEATRPLENYRQVLQRLADDAPREGDEKLLAEAINLLHLSDQAIQQDVQAIRDARQYERELQAIQTKLAKLPTIPELQEKIAQIDSELAVRIDQMLAPKREALGAIERRRVVEESLRQQQHQLNLVKRESHRVFGD